MEKIRLESSGKESRFSVEKRSSHSDEKFCRGPFCAVLQKFLVAKTFTDERGGEHQDFSPNLFIS